MFPLIEWLLPVAVGALIGYVTNAIAIKMLFRPLEEKRIGPFRIPFTPGVIPRQRHQLAKSLGRVVSRELLNPEVILSHLKSLEINQRLSFEIEKGLRDFFALNLNQISHRYRDFFSPTFELMAGAFDRGVDWLRETPLAKVLSLFPEQSRQEISESDTQIPQVLEDPHPFVESLVGLLFPLFKQEMESWVRSPPVLSQLTTTGQRLLDQAIEEMNPLQRVLVRSLGYDQQLSESMPGLSRIVVDRFVAYFNLPEEQKDFSRRVALVLSRFFLQETRKGFLRASIRSWIEDHRDRSILEAVALFLNIPENELLERIQNWKKGLVDQIVELLEKIIDKEWAQKPLGSLLSIQEDFFKSFADRVSSSLMDRGVEALPEILASLDLPAMLEKRVNDMDLETVESMLLQIMQKQFKWINIFGAILGAALGLLQGLWRVLLPWLQ